MHELLPDLIHLPGAQVTAIETAINLREPDLNIGHGPRLQALMQQLPELTVTSITPSLPSVLAV